MFAADNRLSNLVLIIDNNEMQATAKIQDVLAVELLPEKFEESGCAEWCASGNCAFDVLGAFTKVRMVMDRPYLVMCDTRIFDEWSV